MPNYRRLYVPGGTVFLTVATHQRVPLFADPVNVERLREAVRTVRKEQPFDLVAAVILPEHLHFLWTLPTEDGNYSKRLGRIKVAFTHALRGVRALPKDVSLSRRKHRESNVWQRRFFDHLIRDERDFEEHLHYIHYNPVKHGHVSCPHAWPYSSFLTWVRQDGYPSDWACVCGGRPFQASAWQNVAAEAEAWEEGDDTCPSAPRRSSGKSRAGNNLPNS